MSQFDKVEVMDFLINVLKDHEKSLDELIARAEVIVNEKSATRQDTENHDSLFPMRIVLKDWKEFKRKALSIDLVCFNLLNEVFVICASHGHKLYEYRESIPKVDLDLKSIHSNGKNLIGNYKLSIGLDLVTKITTDSDGIEKRLVYDIDPQYTKAWLSRELHVHQNFIVCGEIEI